MAVLIANVAYVGYLSTPGGPNPWWADCDYPLFIAFIITNGFALVFSVAAIVAVLLGPYILLRQRRLHWRQPVVNLGLCHLLCSLASLLAAFALAGFITASVGAPPVSCAKITCDRGGVPCSPYTKTGSDLVLDPAVAQLNNRTFFGSAQNYSADTPVVCQDYNLIAYSTSGGPCEGPHARLLDTFGYERVTSCYYFLATALVPPLHSTSVTSAQSSRRKPNPLTMWCSADRAAVGPGYIPLNMGTAYRLLDLVSGSHYYNASMLPYDSSSSVVSLFDTPSALLDPFFPLCSFLQMGRHCVGVCYFQAQHDDGCQCLLFQG